MGYQDVDLASGNCVLLDRIEVLGERDTAPVDDATHRFCTQSPLRDPIRFRESRVLRLSDFFTKSALRRLEFYVEVWRPLGIDDYLRLWLPAPPHPARVVLLLKPHLIRLPISRPHTVRKHLENVFGKLGVHTRTAAAARWATLGSSSSSR